MFDGVSNEKNYKYAMTCLAIGTIFMFFSMFALPVIVVSPYKFVMFFSLAMVCFLGGMAFMNGPRSYLKKLTTRKNRIPSAVLLLSILSGLYASMVYKSYLIALLFCFIEVRIY